MSKVKDKPKNRVKDAVTPKDLEKAIEKGNGGITTKDATEILQKDRQVRADICQKELATVLEKHKCSLRPHVEVILVQQESINDGKVRFAPVIEAGVQIIPM